jgi:hypothetical protein
MPNYARSLMYCDSNQSILLIGKRKDKRTMSNQSEYEHQQTMTPKEVRESLLADLEAGKQAIAELSDEYLAEVQGAGLTTALYDGFSGIVRMLRRPEAGGRQFGRTLSAPGRLQGN